MSDIIMVPACRVRGAFTLPAMELHDPTVSLGKGDTVRYREGENVLRFRSASMKVNGPDGSIIPLEGILDLICYKGDPAANAVSGPVVESLPSLLSGVAHARLLVYALAMNVVTGVVETRDGQDAVWTMV